MKVERRPDGASAPHQPLPPVRNTEAVRVMGVSDDETALRRYGSMVQGVGESEWISFNNTQDALFWSLSNRPSLIILDTVAPSHVGLDFLRRTRNSDELRGTPVIVFAAYGDRESRRRALALGAIEVIVREADPAESAARVRALISMMRNLASMDDRIVELTASLQHAQGRSQRYFERLRALHTMAALDGQAEGDVLTATLHAGAMTLRSGAGFFAMLSRIDEDAVRVVALAHGDFDAQHVTRMPRAGDEARRIGSLDAMIAATGTSVSWDDFARDTSMTRLFRVLELGLRSAIGCAFLVEGKTYVLMFGSRRPTVAVPLDDEDRTYVELLCGVFALLIHQGNQASRIRYQAERDGLTGLYNRAAFRDRLAFRANDEQSRPFAVLLFDLDHFKEINDTLGHPTGDLVLNEIASRLLAASSDMDVVARMGGDEFAFILDRCDSVAEATDLAQKCIALCQQPIVRDDLIMQIGSSVGIASYPNDGKSVETLLSHADAALYEAKRSGRSTYSVFDKAVADRLSRRRSLATELREALDRREFVLFYQPEVNLKSGEITGFEALIRWEHPRRGLVGPGEFIPFAEETGFIRKIGSWVIEQACFDIPRILRGIQGRVFVNLSAAQLSEATFVSEAQALMERYHIPSHTIGFEITETMAMSDPALTLKIVQELRETGCSVAIDDFGTGYSSLAYLKTMQPDVIKIDRAFVKGLPDDVGDAAIVETVVLFAEKTGRGVLAEGIELEEQYDWLRDVGVHFGQGFGIAKPMPMTQALQWVRRWKNDHTAAVPGALATMQPQRLGEFKDVRV